MDDQPRSGSEGVQQRESGRSLAFWPARRRASGSSVLSAASFYLRGFDRLDFAFVLRDLAGTVAGQLNGGSTGSEWLTWAMNAYVPALVAERFAKSRIVAFSTACVYPFVSTDSDGATEAVARRSSSARSIR